MSFLRSRKQLTHEQQVQEKFAAAIKKNGLDVIDKEIAAIKAINVVTQDDIYSALEALLDTYIRAVIIKKKLDRLYDAPDFQHSDSVLASFWSLLTMEVNGLVRSIYFYDDGIMKMFPGLADKVEKNASASTRLRFAALVRIKAQELADEDKIHDADCEWIIKMSYRKSFIGKPIAPTTLLNMFNTAIDKVNPAWIIKSFPDGKIKVVGQEVFQNPRNKNRGQPVLQKKM